MRLDQRLATRFPRIFITDAGDHRTVGDLIEEIRDPGEMLRTKFETLRLCVADGQEDEADRIKREDLPIVCWSGTFDRRSADALREYSGLIVLDVDKNIQEDPAVLRDSMAGDERIFAVWISPRGRALKVLVYHDGGPDEHRAVFASAVAYMASAYGLEVDETQYDIPRACYVSWDREIVVNPDARPMPARREEPKAQEEASAAEVGGEVKPGEDFNRRGDIRPLLEANGWRLDKVVGANERWTRPGKRGGTGATYDGAHFYVWSSNAPPFVAGQSYSRFAVLAMLGHGGDFREAARELAREGYGRRGTAERVEALAEERPDVRRALEAQEAQERPPVEIRTHADRVRDRMRPAPAIIDGLLPAGGILAIVAAPKSGKSLLGVELARCVASGEPYGGRAVDAGLVVYACPDSPASTERRMLAIEEGVAERIYTVASLPGPGGIPALCEAVCAMAADQNLRAVVIDTWDSARDHGAESWSGQDASVELGMRALRDLAAGQGLGVVVVHHATRADGGRARGSAVFDARADVIALARSAGEGAIELVSKHARDYEPGHVSTWEIGTVELAEGPPVPVLSEQVDVGPVVAGRSRDPDRDARVLDAIAHAQEQGEEPSLRGIAEEVGLATSSIHRSIERLRAAGHVATGHLLITPAGADWLALG